MEIYHIYKGAERWKYKAYDYIRTDAFCVGQGIPVELEFSHDEPEDELEAVIIIEDHKPVAGCRITYPNHTTGKIERVCVVREKQRSGYGKLLIAEAESWIKEKGIKHIVISSQDRALGFYEKIGYVINKNTDPYVYEKAKNKKDEIHKQALKIPDLGFSCVLVEKDLSKEEYGKAI